MIKWLDNNKRSIKHRITTMMVSSLVLIMIGAVLVVLSTYRIVEKFDDTITDLSVSQDHITKIANYSNEIILRARGYFAYLDKYEYEQILEAKKNLEDTLESFKSTPLNERNQELIQRVESFFDYYLTNILPNGAVYAENGDYESLRELITPGSENPTNEIIHYAFQSEELIEAQIQGENQRLYKDLVLQGIYFIIYIILVLILSLYITNRLATDIGNPLIRLSKYAIHYRKGEDIERDILDREDEIGHLSKSLNNMVHELQENEEELIAQNEELTAQQDELQIQQDELQIALGKMEQNEVYLNKRNVLVQSMATTLEKEELLDSIIRNVVEITASEKGILVLSNESKDYAAYGVSQVEAKQFVDGLEQSAAVRSLQSKQLYIREREATDGEKGYVTEHVQAYDVFVPILKGNEEIAACLVLTRVGRAIGNSDRIEITGLAGQISLSLEKLEMFGIAEEQRRMTKTMLNTIQEGIQLLSMDGRLLQVNHKLYELIELPYESSELMGVRLEEFMAHLTPIIENADSLSDFIRKALKSEGERAQRSMNYVLRLQNNEKRYIQVYWEPIYRNNYQMGILLVHRDITKEHEVDRMKSEFVSTVSHELRTPLASILGYSELLLHRELKPERQRKYMATIHQEAIRLTQLVNDFLDLQRIENGMQFYSFKPMDIVSLVEEVREIQQASTTNHKLIWKADHKSVTVLGDRDKMFQTLVNLVSNAIKYSPVGGDILISSRLENDRIWIDITDKGLGIPEQALSKLFTKFYRVDNSDRREIGGTGLGLAIVKEIIEQHKGEVKVSSRFGEGSTFSIMIPVLKNTELEVSAEKVARNSLENAEIHVMIIENDHSLSVMLEDELVESGYRTTVYSDGSSAIRAMEERQPHIIVLDLKLEPEMSGWEVIERMKASERLKDIPIIISSAFEEKAKAMQYGISHFFIKPYVPAQLIEAIAEEIKSIDRG